MSMGMRYEYDDRDWDDMNPIAANDHEEWRGAGRFAPETVRAGDCRHVGGIRRGASTCSWCGEGP